MSEGQSKDSKSAEETAKSSAAPSPVTQTSAPASSQTGGLEKLLETRGQAPVAAPEPESASAPSPAPSSPAVPSTAPPAESQKRSVFLTVSLSGNVQNKANAISERLTELEQRLSPVLKPSDKAVEPIPQPQTAHRSELCGALLSADVQLNQCLQLLADISGRLDL